MADALPEYRAAVGLTKDITFTANNPATGRAWTNTWTNSDTLACVVWLGDDRATAFSPTAAWTDATAGTGTIRVAASNTNTLSPVRYRGQVRVTDVSDSNTVHLLHEFWLRLTPAPGSATALPVYGTLEGMRRLTGEKVDALLEATDLGDGNEILALARDVTDRTVLSRARTILETQLERHTPVVASDPIEPTTGVDAGPAWGPSVYPETSVRDQMTTIQTALSSNQLMTSLQQDKAVVAANNHLALAELFYRQTGQGEADEKYRAMGHRHRAEGLRLLAGWTARIDTDSDGVANYEIPPQ